MPHSQDAAPPKGFHIEDEPTARTDLSDARIGLVLTDSATTLLQLDEQVRVAERVADLMEEPPMPPRGRPGFSPPLVLVLGNVPVTQLLLEAGAMPVEVAPEPREATPSHASEMRCAGAGVLAERVDAVLAMEGWNEDAAARDAVLSAAKKGTRVFFDLISARAWLRRRDAARASAALRAAKDDADEVLTRRGS